MPIIMIGACVQFVFGGNKGGTTFFYPAINWIHSCQPLVQKKHFHSRSLKKKKKMQDDRWFSMVRHKRCFQGLLQTKRLWQHNFFFFTKGLTAHNTGRERENNVLACLFTTGSERACETYRTQNLRIKSDWVHRASRTLKGQSAAVQYGRVRLRLVCDDLKHRYTKSNLSAYICGCMSV